MIQKSVRSNLREIREMTRSQWLIFALFLSSCPSAWSQGTEASNQQQPGNAAALPASAPSTKTDASKEPTAKEVLESNTASKNVPEKKPASAPATIAAPKTEPIATDKNNPPEKKPIEKKAVPSKTSEAAKKKVDVAKVTDGIQKQYNSISSAIFDFEQSYKHPFLAVTESSKGKVSYAKSGGKMVWSYLEPKQRQKQFFINGNKFTYYLVNDKIAYTHDCYDQDTLSASVTFLLGKGSLKDSFTISELTGEIPNSALTWLTLIPKEKDSSVKKIALGVGPDARVTESIVEDASGGKNHFKFINFKANPKIADSVFVFSAPKGVMVQPMPNVSCPSAPAGAPKKPEPPATKNTAKAGNPVKK